MDKGDIHVDWILSMGMFLIATIALFIFFRPGALPPQDKTLILNHLITKFNENFTWEVKTMPIFVKKCIGGTINPTESEIEINYLPAPNWILSYIKYTENNALLKEWETSRPGGRFFIKCFAIEYLDSFHFSITEGDNAIFYLTFVNDIITSERLEISTTCTPAEGNANYCIYKLGSFQDFEGVNERFISEEANIDDPDPNNYDNYFNLNNIKNNWQIPNNIEFSITSQDLNLNYRTANPPQQADIFSREIKTFTVNKRNNIKQVSILFKVW